MFGHKKLLQTLTVVVFSALTALLSYLPSVIIRYLSLTENVIVLVGVFFASLFFARVILVGVSTAFFERFRIRLDTEERGKITDLVSRQSPQVLSSSASRGLSFIFGTHIKQKNDALADLIDSSVFCATSFLYTFIYLGVQDWALLVFILPVSAAWVAANFYIFKYVKFANRAARIAEERSAKTTTALIEGANLIRLYSSFEFFNAKIRSSNDDYENARRKYTKTKVILFTVGTLFFSFSQLGLILVGYWRTGSDPAVFISIVYISGMILAPIQKLNSCINFHALNELSKSMIHRETSTWSEIGFSYKSLDVRSFVTRNLVCNHGSFKISYPDLDFDENGIYKIDAPSGKGKTSFFKMIIGEHTDFSGTISVIAKNGFTDNTIGLRINYLSQHRTVIPGTLLENITMGSKINSSKVIDAMKSIGLGAYSSNLNRHISEDDMWLSGGQFRRIEILRACLGAGSILLLDEPFTGLDAASYELASQLIRKASKGKVVVIASHVKFKGLEEAFYKDVISF